MQALVPRRRFRARPGPRARPDPQREYATLGAPPEDPLAAIEWALEALTVSLYHVINDQTLEEKHRRREMREITRAMATLEPKSRLYDAEERIRGDRDQLEDQSSGPEMEDATKLPAEACRAAPARGRPRR